MDSTIYLDRSALAKYQLTYNIEKDFTFKIYFKSKEVQPYQIKDRWYIRFTSNKKTVALPLWDVVYIFVYSKPILKQETVKSAYYYDGGKIKREHWQCLKVYKRKDLILMGLYGSSKNI